MDQTVTSLINGVQVQAVLGIEATKVTSLASDSRKVRKGAMFFALKGTALDGHEFIPQAQKAGATVIVCQGMPHNIDLR